MHITWWWWIYHSSIWMKPATIAPLHQHLGRKSQLYHLHINMEISACFTYTLTAIVATCVVESQFTGHMARYDGPDFSHAPTCTQFLPCVTVRFEAHGKWHCALMAQWQQSDIFVYDVETTECQLCPLSIATDKGSTIPGPHIAFVRGQYILHWRHPWVEIFTLQVLSWYKLCITHHTEYPINLNGRVKETPFRKCYDILFKTLHTNASKS